MGRHIIGIVGVAGSGKTLVWRHLIEKHGFAKVSFAGPVRKMLIDGLGLPAEMVEGDGKETPEPMLCGRTGRQLTRTLINDWGRKQVGRALWCNIWMRDAIALDGSVVADDVRHPDEAAVIRALGGEIWKVYRPGLNSSDQATENAQRGIEEDRLLANATSIPDLIRSVDALVEQLKET